MGHCHRLIALGDLEALHEPLGALLRGISELMTRTPRTIEPDRLAADCIVLMETPPKVTQLIVVDSAGALVGALHVHDLFRARVV